MGYYSDAAIALTKNGICRMHDKLSATDTELAQEVRQMLQGADFHCADHATESEVWRWKDIKWYPCDPVYYPEINFLEDLLWSLDEDDFRFIRIGEDYDDTEVRGQFTENPFDLELARTITLSAPVSSQLPSSGLSTANSQHDSIPA